MALRAVHVHVGVVGKRHLAHRSTGIADFGRRRRFRFARAEFVPVKSIVNALFGRSALGRDRDVIAEHLLMDRQVIVGFTPNHRAKDSA